MADLQMRPRFAVDVPGDVATLVAMLEETVERADPPLEGKFDTGHCVLRIPKSRRAFWSPELDLTFESTTENDGESNGLLVRCLFAPRPAVWTGFAFVFAILGAFAVAGGLYGMAQITLGETPLAFWAIPIALVLAALTYASSFIGQGLALAQMYELRRTFDAGVSRAEEQARRDQRHRSYQI